MKRVTVLLFAAACASAPAAHAAPLDLGRQTYSILPAGQTGSMPPDRFGTNQLKLYDDLAPLFGDVGPADIKRLFKSARFFSPRGGEATRPRRRRHDPTRPPVRRAPHQGPPPLGRLLRRSAG